MSTAASDNAKHIEVDGKAMQFAAKVTTEISPNLGQAIYDLAGSGLTLDQVKATLKTAMDLSGRA